MFKQLAPVSLETHKDTRIAAQSNYAFAKEVHLAAVMAAEFIRAAAHYPIVFIEGEQAQFKPVVLLGFQTSENLWVDESGQWDAAYIPAIIRRYPFALAPKPDSEEFAVCLDVESDLLGDQGNPLFNDDGAPSEMLERAKQFLGELNNMEVATKGFCEVLTQHNLLTPLNVRVQLSNGARDVAGCYVVNQDRLNKLADQDFLALRNANALAPIFHHLASLQQIESLVKREQALASATRPTY